MPAPIAGCCDLLARPQNRYKPHEYDQQHQELETRITQHGPQLPTRAKGWGIQPLFLPLRIILGLGLGVLETRGPAAGGYVAEVGGEGVPPRPGGERWISERLSAGGGWMGLAQLGSICGSQSPFAGFEIAM